MDTQDKLTFSRKSAAEKLGISVVSLDREVARRRIAFVRLGRRVLFTEKHLLEYLDRNTHVQISRSGLNGK